jgi:hypothetical protein
MGCSNDSFVLMIGFQGTSYHEYAECLQHSAECIGLYEPIVTNQTILKRARVSTRRVGSSHHAYKDVKTWKLLQDAGWLQCSSTHKATSSIRLLEAGTCSSATKPAANKLFKGTIDGMGNVALPKVCRIHVLPIVTRFLTYAHAHSR